MTHKADVRTYNNSKGAGKLLSVDLLDAQGGEIRATMFNEQVDKFNPMLEEKGVYLISGGTLKQANRKFTSLKHDYEITFNSSTQIERCPDGANEIKLMQYQFVPVSESEVR